MTGRRVLAALLLVLAAGCTPPSDHSRVPDRGSVPYVDISPSAGCGANGGQR